MFVDAEAVWASMRARSETSQAGKKPRAAATAILKQAKEIFLHQAPGAGAGIAVATASGLSAPPPPPPPPPPPIATASATSATAEVEKLAQLLEKFMEKKDENEKGPVPASAEASELLQLKLAAAQRTGADDERSRHEPKADGTMEVTYESQLALMQKLAKAEAKNEMVSDADARVDARMAVQGGQASQLIATLSGVTTQAVGAMTGQLVGMQQMPYGRPPPFVNGWQTPMAGHPQLQGPQPGHPQLQGPQPGLHQLQGPNQATPSCRGPNQATPSCRGPNQATPSCRGPNQAFTSCRGPKHSPYSCRGPKHSPSRRGPNQASTSCRGSLAACNRCTQGATCTEHSVPGVQTLPRVPHRTSILLPLIKSALTAGTVEEHALGPSSALRRAGSTEEARGHQVGLSGEADGRRMGPAMSATAVLELASL